MLYSQVKEAIKQSDKDTVRKVLDTYDEDVLIAALDCNVSVENILEAYQGEHNSDKDFVRELLEGLGEIPENLPGYIHIDWESTVRDVMMDYSESNGHYFRVL